MEYLNKIRGISIIFKNKIDIEYAKSLIKWMGSCGIKIKLHD